MAPSIDDSQLPSMVVAVGDDDDDVVVVVVVVVVVAVMSLLLEQDGIGILSFNLSLSLPFVMEHESASGYCSYCSSDELSTDMFRCWLECSFEIR